MSESLQNDIAYMKSLAEAGAAGPLKNGATLFWAGLLYGLASVAQYAMTVGWLPRTNLVGIAIWFGTSLVFGVLATYLGFARRREACSATDRASGHAWAAVGLGIMAFIATVIIVAYRSHEFSATSFLMAPVILLMYGMGWWVSGKMSGIGWVKLVALGCFVAAPVLGLMSGMPEQLLAYAVCLTLFATVPGFVLMRAQKV